MVGGIFGVVAGAAPNFAVLALFIAFIGFGVGGNLPVDGTMFIEFIPGKHQYLLTLLSVWWAIGQVAGSLIAVSGLDRSKNSKLTVQWGFLAKYGCETRMFSPDHKSLDLCTAADGSYCSRDSNQGWRYTFFTLGAMMIFLWYALVKSYTRDSC